MTKEEIKENKPLYFFMAFVTLLILIAFWA